MNGKIKFLGRTQMSRTRPGIAGILLGCVAAAMLYGVFLMGFAGSDVSAASGEDLRCYRSIVERVHSGQGYYEAAHEELSLRYPTQSLFNWRLPYLAWAMGWLPDLVWAQLLGILLALGSIGLWFDLSRGFLPFPAAAAGSILLLGMPIYSFSPDVFLAHEFWAGCLITLSILTYARGWFMASLLAAVLALMVRELSLLYVAVMLALSFRERKIQEALHWLAVIVLFAGLMAVHFAHVREYTGVGVDGVHPWITLGGWKFVLATCSMHPYLMLLAPWIAAILVPLSVVGLLGWRGPLGSRIGATVCVYMTAFMIIGQSFNRYWGVLYVNLLPLGLLFAPAAVRDLFYSAATIPTGESVAPVKECKKTAV